MTARRVTDHAVVRWLERVHGLNHLADRYGCDRDRASAGAAILGLTVDECREAVFPEPAGRTAAAIELRPRAETWALRYADRTLVLRDLTVVTCLGRDQRPSHHA